MQPHRTVDEAPAPQPPASALVTAPVVPQRSARRATAHRASSRRATARLRKGDIEERVSEYLNEHPLSTTGDLAKGLNADRGKVAQRGRTSRTPARPRRTTTPDDQCADAPKPRDVRGARLRPGARADHHGQVGRRPPTRHSHRGRGRSRAARRARSMSLPTTAARAATASRSGPRAVRLRPTRSCTACSPSLDCRSTSRLGKLALANGRRAPHQRRRHRPPGPSSPCLRRLTKRRASRARYGRHRSLGPRFA